MAERSASDSTTRTGARRRNRSPAAGEVEAGASGEASKARGSTPASGVAPDWLATVAELSFQEARTALELTLAKLQADDLEVEEMAGLYRRAEAYAARCEAVLEQVEQDVIEWEADTSAGSGA
jgi:exodeoxyribonuclease VII small subunit